MGGSIDATCDRQSGDCNCKPNMVGRICDKPKDGFYCPTLDHLIYEAENAKQFDQRTQLYMRSINSIDSRNQQRKTWTGTGFVRVFEGGSLEFTVSNIFKAGNYEIVIRYEHTQSSEPWEDLRVTLTRQGPPVDLFCVDYDSKEDEKQTNLPLSKLIINLKIKK